MIRDDYLLRVIKQFAEALARMIRRREEGAYDEALQEADRLYEELGIPRDLIDVVDTPTLAAMLREADRMRVAAKLCWEEGHVYKAKGDPLTAFARYRRAHELFLEARAIAPTADDDAALFELSRLAPAQLLDARYRTGGSF